MFPSGGEWIHQWRIKTGSIHSLTTWQSQSETLTVRSCYLWPLARLPACCRHGHESDNGCAFCPGMTQTQSYALDTEPACLMEREGRGQSAAWVQEAWERLRSHSMTDGHDTCTQAEKHRGMHTHMDTSINTKHTHMNQAAEHTKSGLES